MSEPTVTLIADGPSFRFRIEGGKIAPGWNPRGTPWCEIGIWGDSDRLSSFGGEVWPLAWPALFRQPEQPSLRRTGAEIELTEAGKAAIAAARADASREAWLCSLAKTCRCCAGCGDVPCGGCQQGAPCDEMSCRCGDSDERESHDFDGLDGGES